MIKRVWQFRLGWAVCLSLLALSAFLTMRNARMSRYIHQKRAETKQAALVPEVGVVHYLREAHQPLSIRVASADRELFLGLPVTPGTRIDRCILIGPESRTVVDHPGEIMAAGQFDYFVRFPLNRAKPGIHTVKLLGAGEGNGTEQTFFFELTKEGGSGDEL